MRELLEKKAILIGVVLVGAIVLAIFLFTDKSGEDISAMFAESTQVAGNESESKPVDEKEPQIFKVDVKGAVIRPGVYEVKEGERVIDVIERAGGFRENADSLQVNLSQRVHDEMVIYVPVQGENIPVSTLLPAPAGTSNNGKININTASATELETLPGIGPQKAEAIIQYREENGPFQKAEDLMKVSGIGEKTFEKLKEHIVAP